MADTEQAGGRTLAQKLDHLFRTVHPGRGEYSFDEVAKAIQARGGPTISATYLWQLRKGLRDNPTKKHLEALADFFGVSPAYFFDDAAAERIDAELALLAALRDASVRQVALRAVGLSPQTLDAIAEMIDRIRQLEGLPDAGGSAPPQRG
jgi:transcriptional regulator with XRE-family HTH domain